MADVSLRYAIGLFCLTLSVVTAGAPNVRPGPMGQFEQGADFNGGDLYSRPASSAAQCAGICTGDVRCRAMTYIPSQNLCWIKDRLTSFNPQANGEMVTAARRLVIPQVNSGNRVMASMEYGVSYNGNDVDSKVTAGPEECAYLCLANLDCKVTTYIISQHACWIKNGIATTPTPSRDMISVRIIRK